MLPFIVSFFHQCLIVSDHRSFISLVNIPTYFTSFFDAIVNGIAVLISLCCFACAFSNCGEPDLGGPYSLVEEHGF